MNRDCSKNNLKTRLQSMVHQVYKGEYSSQCQNSSKFLSISYLMKTADVIMNFFSSHNTTDHTQ